MADILAPGTKAPDFEATDQDGKALRLRDFEGRPVVLYFYPADMTTGCTMEACAFRDEQDKFQALDAVVLGVSTQDAASHREFRAKHGLNFPLLADPDKRIVRAYNTLGFMGVAKRVTYVIGPDGVIVDSFKSLNPKPHVERALRVLSEKGLNHADQAPAASRDHPT
ncbi:MAG TPA: peroxiredoxin [Thermoplasmata archaeon]|nr:peroxiredoxin [Thermoplasmata archaeon]